MDLTTCLTRRYSCPHLETSAFMLEDLTKILLTSAATIIGGVFVYTAGQVITRFFIDPYHEYRKVVGEIADALIYHANVYMNPGGGSPNEPRAARIDATSDTLRQKASLLRVRAYAIPCYNIFAKCRLVSRRESIERASGALIGLSNNIFQGDARENRRLRDEIIRELSLPPL